jgi:hypothetical protein
MSHRELKFARKQAGEDGKAVLRTRNQGRHPLQRVHKESFSPIAGTTHLCDNLISTASVSGSWEESSQFTAA